ncbi:diaminopimelate epimerase [Nakamurella lactea]|uniref:diaminopimelate epimerase n=1 Tax=Nakamurella lactea TaxID=459515 RepID=UPI000403E980|nr:diaminopimelate epimerase [Nakamurella lactea]
MSSAEQVGPSFVKGHGTENDFVLVPDPRGEFELTAERARLICDRRAGIGADGVIRVTPGQDGRYFMDYRNADGSLAEMCGNGARVFARFLVDAGWTPAGRIEFDTRGGVRTADLDVTGDVRIGMGPVTLGGASSAVVAGRELSGRAADVGNPHLVCLIDGDPAELDLREAPGYDAAAFPHGVNIEFVRPDGPDAVTMRVYERGSGETCSCGTGTVAAAAVHLAAQGLSEGTVAVTVPGGRVQVRVGADGADLTGPAVLVYSGTLNPAVLAG